MESLVIMVINTIVVFVVSWSSLTYIDIQFNDFYNKHRILTWLISLVLSIGSTWVIYGLWYLIKMI